MNALQVLRQYRPAGRRQGISRAVASGKNAVYVLHDRTERHMKGQGMAEADETGGKRHPMAFRTTKALKDKIEEAAKQSGRSIALELEHRLEQSLRDPAPEHTEQLARQVTYLANDVERRYSADWRSVSDAATDLAKLVASYIHSMEVRPGLVTTKQGLVDEATLAVAEAIRAASVAVNAQARNHWMKDAATAERARLLMKSIIDALVQPNSPQLPEAVPKLQKLDYQLMVYWAYILGKDPLRIADAVAEASILARREGRQPTDTDYFSALENMLKAEEREIRSELK
jgi:hypothetical protein